MDRPAMKSGGKVTLQELKVDAAGNTGRDVISMGSGLCRSSSTTFPLTRTTFCGWPRCSNPSSSSHSEARRFPRGPRSPSSRRRRQRFRKSSLGLRTSSTFPKLLLQRRTSRGRSRNRSLRPPLRLAPDRRSTVRARSALARGTLKRRATAERHHDLEPRPSVDGRPGRSGRALSRARDGSASSCRSGPPAPGRASCTAAPRSDRRASCTGDSPGLPRQRPPWPPEPRLLPGAPEPAPAPKVNYDVELKELRAVALKIKDLTLFEVLGITESTDPIKVKAAYFRQAKLYHPDTVPPEAPAEVSALKAEIFAKVGEANRRLGDPKARSEYIDELRMGTSDRQHRPDLRGRGAVPEGLHPGQGPEVCRRREAPWMRPSRTTTSRASSTPGAGTPSSARRPTRSRARPRA